MNWGGTGIALYIVRFSNHARTTKKTGGSDMKWTPRILNKPIPQGGFGRRLTSSEIKKIRANGWKCGKNWIVVRAYDSSSAGIVYSPCKTGGFNHAGIYVTD